MRALAAALARPGTGRGRLGVPLVGRRLVVRLAIVFAAAAAVAAAYVLWFRDSGFVRVEHVSVSGATGAQAPALRRTLTQLGRDMTTLNVREDRLARAAAAYPTVAELQVSADFPARLRIRVVEHRPVAVAVAGAARIPVAGDGRLLRGLTARRRLPEVEVPGTLGRGRLRAGGVLRAVWVAAAAPPPLRARLSEVLVTRERGLVARLRRGPEIAFGDAGRLPAKWIAAARVLAEPAARGARYVDVRLPERPAAGVPQNPQP